MRFRRSVFVGCFLLTCGFGPGPCSALTSISFGELSERPLDGVSLNGVTFHFSGTGSDFPVALFGTTSLAFGQSSFMAAPWAVGTTSGELTLEFHWPVNLIAFDAGLATTATLPAGFSVRLYQSSDLIATFSRPTFPRSPGPFAFSENSFAYSQSGQTITSAVITFDTSSAENFVFDDLSFNQVPEPSAGVILLAGSILMLRRSFRVAAGNCRHSERREKSCVT